MLFCRPLCDASYVSLPGKRAAASRLCEKATSPFSPSLRLWKPWKTASGLCTVPTACAHPLFPLWLSPYTEKVFIFVPRTYSCRDGQSAACQYGKEKQTAHRRFYPQKKPRSMTKKKPSTTLMAWCWALSDCSDFQRVKQCSACKQLFRILLLGVKMYCSAKSYAQKRAAYTLSCFAF